MSTLKGGYNIMSKFIDDALGHCSIKMELLGIIVIGEVLLNIIIERLIKNEVLFQIQPASIKNSWKLSVERKNTHLLY